MGVSDSWGKGEIERCGGTKLDKVRQKNGENNY